MVEMANFFNNFEFKTDIFGANCPNASLRQNMLEHFDGAGH